MKGSKKLLHITALLLFIIAMSLVCPAFAQDKMSKKERKEAERQVIKSLVESGTYQFNASTAYTNKGRSVNITGTYGIIITPTKISCDLPFYGQSYGGAGYGGEGPITFESADFSYDAKPGKKGGWEIVIKPNDKKEIQTIMLDISEDGFANANVTSTSRTPMRYAGTAGKIESREKK